MNKVQAFLFGSAVFAASTLTVVSARTAAYADGPAGPAPLAHGAPMRGMMGAGAPLISIALQHQTELGLTGDQVATLEKIRTQFQSQTTPARDQLRAIEGEIRGLLQQSPANLIQVKLKVAEAEKVRSDLRYQQIEAIENGKSVLNTQQQDQLKNLVTSMRQNFRAQHGQPS
jgi:Spy/CpxP family protein refolding chaperone